jgi:hypothetical protein
MFQVLSAAWARIGPPGRFYPHGTLARLVELERHNARLEVLIRGRSIAALEVIGAPPGPRSGTTAPVVQGTVSGGRPNIAASTRLVMGVASFNASDGPPSIFVAMLNPGQCARR